jgi:hypothetical protein
MIAGPSGIHQYVYRAERDATFPLGPQGVVRVGRVDPDETDHPARCAQSHLLARRRAAFVISAQQDDTCALFDELARGLESYTGSAAQDGDATSGEEQGRRRGHHAS